METLNKPTMSYDLQYHHQFVDRWDELINWKGRAEGEAGFFQRLFKADGVVNVADVACGSGFHSIEFKTAGFNVFASDGSPSMVAKANENALKAGVDLHAKVVDWRDIDFGEVKVDAIVCLGSSFCHLRTKSDQLAALKRFYNGLRPGGCLLLDQRNFDVILAGKYSSKGKYYYCGDQVSVGFEDLRDDNVNFIYTFVDGAKYELSVNPIRFASMRSLLDECGFVRYAAYGDFEQDFEMESSDFLLHRAYKPLV